MNTGKIIGIIALSLVVIVTGLLATKTYNPTWSPFRPTPETVIEKTGKNLKNIETFSSNVNVSLSKENQEVDVVVDYKYDGRDPEKTKMEGNGKLNFMTEGMSITGETDFITEDKKLYLKVKTFPAPLSPYLQMLGINSSSIKDKWIEVSTSSGKITKEEEVTENFEIKLQEKLKDLFIAKEEYKDEKINGNDSYHYLVELDTQKTKEVIKDITKEINPDSKLENAEIDDLFGQTKGIMGEVWIGKDDYNIYKIKTNSEMNNVQSSETPAFNLEVTFSNFNEKFDISAPEEYTSLKELMMQGNSMFQQQLEGLNQQQLEGMEGAEGMSEEDLRELEKQIPEGAEIPSQQYQY